MSLSRSVLLALLGAGLLSVSSLPARAQTHLLAEHADGKFYTVLKLRDDQPLALIGGRLTVATGKQLALKRTDDYLPAAVEVHDLAAFEHADVVAAGAGHADVTANKALEFYATFVSAFDLKDVFMVLELDTEFAGKKLFAYGLGDLQAQRPLPFSVVVNAARDLGKGRFALHLYSEGGEVFNSTQAPGTLALGLDRLVAHRIAGVTEAEPRPLFIPAPPFPPTATGHYQVVATVHVSERGEVENPQLHNSSNPALDPVIAQILGHWRFLPRLRAGRAVAADVSIPLSFELGAPVAPAAK